MTRPGGAVAPPGLVEGITQAAGELAQRSAPARDVEVPDNEVGGGEASGLGGGRAGGGRTELGAGPGGDGVRGLAGERPSAEPLVGGHVDDPDEDGAAEDRGRVDFRVERPAGVVAGAGCGGAR